MKKLFSRILIVVSAVATLTLCYIMNKHRWGQQLPIALIIITNVIMVLGVYFLMSSSKRY